MLVMTLRLYFFFIRLQTAIGLNKNAALYAAFHYYNKVLPPCLQTETDVGYAGQDFAFHYVPHTDMQRIALPQVDVR